MYTNVLILMRYDPEVILNSKIFIVKWIIVQIPTTKKLFTMCLGAFSIYSLLCMQYLHLKEQRDNIEGVEVTQISVWVGQVLFADTVVQMMRT